MTWFITNALEAGRCGTFTIQFKRPAPAELGVIAEIIPDSELICATGAKLPPGRRQGKIQTDGLHRRTRTRKNEKTATDALVKICEPGEAFTECGIAH